MPSLSARYRLQLCNPSRELQLTHDPAVEVEQIAEAGGPFPQQPFGKRALWHWVLEACLGTGDAMMPGPVDQKSPLRDRGPIRFDGQAKVPGALFAEPFDEGQVSERRKTLARRQPAIAQ